MSLSKFLEQFPDEFVEQFPDESNKTEVKTGAKHHGTTTSPNDSLGANTRKSFKSYTNNAQEERIPSQKEKLKQPSGLDESSLTVEVESALKDTYSSLLDSRGVAHNAKDKLNIADKVIALMLYVSSEGQNNKMNHDQVVVALSALKELDKTINCAKEFYPPICYEFLDELKKDAEQKRELVKNQDRVRGGR